MQTLFAVVENLSSQTLPEGALRWRAVVKKVSGGSFYYSGTETLKPLRSFKSVEIQCGAFETEARLGVAAVERDRIDYELILLHNEKETTRIMSTANFAALVENAQVVAKLADADAVKLPKNESLPAAKVPKSAEVAIPVAEIVKSNTEPPPVPQRAFDFFNLGGKRASEVK